MKYLYVILLFFAACQSEQLKEESAAAEAAYFDLAKLVQADIEHNTRNACKEEKQIVVNGKAESRKTDSADWKKELQILLDCDINKPSWKGKFIRREDKRSDGTLICQVFTATSDKLPVRRMYIQYNNDNEIANVTIDKKIRSFLFSNEQQIVYQPEKSFKINATQKALFMKDFNSEVDVEFLCGH